MRKALAILAFFGLCLPLVARADVPSIQTTASLTANGQSTSLPLSGQSSCAVVLTGTWSATIAFKTSADLSNFVPASAYNNTTGAVSANATTNATYTFPVHGGDLGVQVIVTSYTSGTVGVSLACGNGAAPPLQSVQITDSSNAGVGLKVGSFGSADGLAASFPGIPPYQLAFNGSTWDRLMVCPNSVAISTNTAATTQLVAASGSTKVYVCSVNFIAGGSTNVTLEYGTGTNCGTGTTALTGAYPLAAQTGIAMAVGLGSIFRTPASQALCLVNSAAIQVSGILTYVQY